MAALKLKSLYLSDSDLDFVVREAGIQIADRERFKQLIREDISFRKALISDDKLFQRVISDKEVFLLISPALYFEILLRHAQKVISRTPYTVEKIGRSQVHVFDTEQVVELLAREEILEYLADLLASFTRTESYSIPVRVKRGVWRRIRFSDMDIDVLSRMCSVVGEEQKFSFYKRIADICLFILGVYPEFTYFDYMYPFSQETITGLSSAGRKGIQEYEQIGKKFYQLAGEHYLAKRFELTEVFQKLCENFNVAWKPLNFLAQHYLRHRTDYSAAAN